MQEIKARKGKVISVITEGDEVSTSLSDDVMIIPEADEIVAPMISVVPLNYWLIILELPEAGC